MSHLLVSIRCICGRVVKVEADDTPKTCSCGRAVKFVTDAGRKEITPWVIEETPDSNRKHNRPAIVKMTMVEE